MVRLLHSWKKVKARIERYGDMTVMVLFMLYEADLEGMISIDELERPRQHR